MQPTKSEGGKFVKKVLFIATVSQHFFYFHQPCFELFKKHGWEVHVACSGDHTLEFVDKRFNLPFSRSPISVQNIIVYKKLKQIINENKYEIIHCHTPVGGVLTRLAARKARKSGTKVIYTAHGFHFFKGASLSGWCIFYPIECFLARFTDCLITINSEDYSIAERKLQCHKVELIHGVGCDNERFCKAGSEEKQLIRKQLGYSPDEKILIYVAELNKNKNQSMLIRAVKQLKDKGKSVRLLLVGPDNARGIYSKLAKKLGVEGNIDFLGRRNDVNILLKACDIAVASSLREGLPVNIMESMTSGLPVVASDNRGHRELVLDTVTGFLTKPDNSCEMADKISLLLDDKELYERMSENAVKAAAPYCKANVLSELEKIYSEFCEDSME